MHTDNAMPIATPWYNILDVHNYYTQHIKSTVIYYYYAIVGKVPNDVYVYIYVYIYIMKTILCVC